MKHPKTGPPQPVIISRKESFRAILRATAVSLLWLLATSAFGDGRVPPETDVLLYAKEPVVLTRKEANTALRRALLGGNHDLAVRLATELTREGRGSGSGNTRRTPPVTLKPTDAYTLLGPLGKELRDLRQPISLLERPKPAAPWVRLETDNNILVDGNPLRFPEGPVHPDDPPPDDDPPGDPGDPGGPGGSGLNAWEASFSSPTELLLAIPPSSLVGVPGHPDVRAQIKWRNHSMPFWRAYYGNLRVDSAYGSGQINWLQVWYEQTHLDSYRNATIYDLGMGSDGFQNHGGAHPNSGTIYNGPTPLTVEQLPDFFDIWNENNPEPMPGFLTEEFLGEQFEAEFGFMYEPDPSLDASDWFLRWLEATGIDWDFVIHPVLDAAPYMWTIVNFSPVNIPPGGISPPPGLLPPLFGSDGQTAGSILAEWNELRFDIRRRLDNGESAQSIVYSYAGPAGVANLNNKYTTFIANQLELMRAAGVSAEVAAQYRDNMLQFTIDNLCGPEPGPQCGPLFSELVDMLYDFTATQLQNEFNYRSQNQLLDAPWLAQARIILQGLPKDHLIRTIAALQDIEGWPPEGLEEFNGFMILQAYFLSNGEEGHLYQQIDVYGGNPGGFLAFLRNVFVDTDRWRDYLPGAEPGPPGPGGPTGEELRTVFPILAELESLIVDDDLDGYDPSWKDFFNTVRGLLEARLRAAVEDDPSILIDPFHHLDVETLGTELLKTVAFETFKDYVATQGIDPNHPASAYILDWTFSAAWEGMLDGIVGGNGAGAFFNKFEDTLLARFGTTNELVTNFGRWSKLVGRGNLAITLAEIAGEGLRIWGEWEQYQAQQLANELQDGLMLYTGPISGREVTAAQYFYELSMGVSSWEMDPYRLALWAAGQGDDGYVGPVTIHFPDGPPAPNNGYDGVAGVWAYGRVHPVLGVSPGDPALDAGIPDLVITGATVNVTPVGADLRVVFSGNVANVGTGRSSASIVGFYWSNSDGYSGGLGAMAQSIPALDAGGSRSFTAVWVEENYRTLVPATYYIQGVADDPEAVFERDEENNGSPELFVITIR